MKMSAGEQKYLLALNRHPQIGAVTLRMLYGDLHSWRDIWNATKSQLSRAGIEPRIAEFIDECRQTGDPESEIELIRKLDLKTVSFLDGDYPERLKTIVDAPAVLYYRGSLDCLTAPAVAIVGTRKLSDYGRVVTERITIPLVRAGITIISGLALGIDSLAHRCAVIEHRPTIAVLGCGLDRVYPPTNTTLAREIIDCGGLVVSEYAPGIPPLKHHFPMRNRIVAGLSDAVVVVEGPITSGSLITAKIALEYNRDVGAVPGDINLTRAEGPNYLIQNGALVVTQADDILSWLGIDSLTQPSIPIEISQEESVLYQIICAGPASVDKLVIVSKMSIAQTNSILSSLEIKGLIARSRGDTYTKL
jgi:DNA processing protein